MDTRMIGSRNYLLLLELERTVINSILIFHKLYQFDVIYDVQEARQEINCLSSIIDMFDLISQEKKKFLEEILKYWILSVKDKKWSYEREQRYVLFLYDDYNYIEFDAVYAEHRQCPICGSKNYYLVNVTGNS